MSAITQGDSVLYQGQRLKVVDEPLGGQVVLQDAGDEHLLIQAPLTEVTPVPPLIEMAQSIGAGEWALLEQLAEAARAVISAPDSATRQRVFAERAAALGISVRTLRRAVKRYQAVPSIIGLRSGMPGRRAGTRVLAERVEAIIRERLEEEWLVGNRPFLTDVHHNIERLCREKDLRPPEISTVRKRAACLDAYEVTKRREGAKAAHYKHKPLVGHIQVARVLEQVQIDHTLADVILVSELDRRVPIGRPWLTLAVDVASRVVVGVHISFDPPSAIAVAMCLENLLLPKDAYLADLKLKGPWPCAGIPECVHVDNGRDFHSVALERGCAELGITLQYRPVGSPHYGGIIERLIGTMMGRCRLLPGATQSNVVARGDYDAEAKATMTLSEFRAFLVNDIVGIYHVSTHRTLMVPPIKKWEELVAGKPLERTIPEGWRAAQVRLAFYPHEERLVRRTGIQLWERHYWVGDLTEWVGRSSAAPCSTTPAISGTFICAAPMAKCCAPRPRITIPPSSPWRIGCGIAKRAAPSDVIRHFLRSRTRACGPGPL
ncbi:transposase TniA [mine drainage metagenome]|uniref:Transposase TniA n=1 Tax=mine drainage metagenome TaxID=410659 RepID=T1ABG4_9ZZZZ